jgi:prepilin-type N-terminal cleavage/methylation domain-containing protein
MVFEVPFLEGVFNMRTRHNAKPKRGFTLIEILIVVVILGILAAIVIPQFAESAEGANHSSARSQLQTVRAQFELCKFRNHCDCGMANWDEIQTTLVDEGYLQGNADMPLGYALVYDATNCRIVATGPVVADSDPADW